MLRSLVALPVTLALTALLFVSSANSGPGTGVALLPDLDQEIPTELQVLVDRSSGKPSYQLGFTSAIRNLGKGPLVIKGHRAGSERTMTADQVVERSDGSEDVVAGIGSLRYVYSYSHQHWHYLHFDRYELRRAGSSRVLVRDRKTGFCLGDRYRVTTVDVADAPPQPAYIGSCGRNDTGLTNIEEGISVGYGDNYRAFLEYQQLPLDGLRDGRYVLVHRVNSDRSLREITYANDAASVLLDLRWRRGVPHLGIVKSCPNSARCDNTRSPLRRRSASAHAARIPEPVAHLTGSFIPNDPAGEAAGGWASLQWNFAGPNGVNAPRAWANLIRAHAPGGAGVTVAVLDTGVAYTNLPPYGVSPDLAGAHFVPGWDFVGDDPYPLDENGHGTHVASTIAEQTNNGYGLAGLAYGATIMPIRVLDANGDGDAPRIARGVMYAVDHGAKVINLSLSFGSSVTAAEIPELLRAFKYARAHGALVVVAAGNDGVGTVSYPARSRDVLAVGATTEYGCAASYSDYGSDLDLVAPGGGADAGIADQYCVAGRTGRPIYQITLDGGPNRFDISNGYVGTSMATPHVTATAALVVASGVLGHRPSPAAITTRLEQTSRDLGAHGRDSRYGWGLLDAAAATAPRATKATHQPARAHRKTKRKTARRARSHRQRHAVQVRRALHG